MRQLGTFLDKVSLGVSKDVGEKTHRYKLDDAAFLEGDGQCAEAKAVKSSIEGFFEKLDIVSGAILKLKKNQS